MDVTQAVLAHSAWKNKLATYLANPDHSLNPVEVAADDRCELGKWLKTQGAKFTDPQFMKLRSEHQRFHKAAGDVVRRADSEHVAAELALGGKSEFAAASAAVVMAIMGMKDRLTSD